MSDETNPDETRPDEVKKEPESPIDVAATEEQKSADSSQGSDQNPNGEQDVLEMAVEAEADLATLQTELNTARDQVLRTQAEMQNLRRRVERDVEKAHKYGMEKLIKELLPVVDNLERAISAIEDDSGNHSAVVEGVELTLKSFQGVLTHFKVEVVDPHGQPFDPELHQAMSMVENPDVEPNTVIEVFQKGYTLHGRLVRPAMVVVAKA